MIVPDGYETQKMYDKAVSILPSTIQFVPYQFKTKEMCDETVDTDIPDWYIT